MKIVRIGLPNLVSSTLVGFAGAFANQLLVQYGTIAVAAMAAAGKSTMMISMLQMGLTMGNPAADGIQLWSRRLRQTQRNYKENSDSDNWNRIGGQCYLFCWKQNSDIIVLKRSAGVGAWSEDDSSARSFRTVSRTLLHLQ